MQYRQEKLMMMSLFSSGTGYVPVLDGIAQEFIDKRIR
jgi:hypothetical protein